MKEFGEFRDKTGCGVWDELWGLKEVFQEVDYKEIEYCEPCGAPAEDSSGLIDVEGCKPAGSGGR